MFSTIWDNVANTNVNKKHECFVFTNSLLQQAHNIHSIQFEFQVGRQHGDPSSTRCPQPQVQPVVTLIPSHLDKSVTLVPTTGGSYRLIHHLSHPHHLEQVSMISRTKTTCKQIRNVIKKSKLYIIFYSLFVDLFQLLHRMILLQ